MKKLIAKIQMAFHNFIHPPTWASITDEERRDLLSLSVKQRRGLAKAVAASQVLDMSIRSSGGPDGGGVDGPGSGADPGDVGIVLGNVLADIRRELIREAVRKDEPKGR